MGDSNDSRMRREQRIEGLDIELATIVDWRHDEARSGLLADHLPRHDVGMVLEFGDEYLVPGTEARARVALRDKIDRLGRSASENDLIRLCGIQKPLHGDASRLVRRGPFRAQGVHAAMDVGVLELVVSAQALDDDTRLLRRRGVVDIHERLAVDAPVEDGEVLADLLDDKRRATVRYSGHRSHGGFSDAVSSLSARLPMKRSSIAWRRLWSGIASTTCSAKA